MLYIIDTNSFRVLGNYYPDVFPTFWTQLEAAVAAGAIGSVREAKKELEVQNVSEHLTTWVENNAGLFVAPTEAEMATVAEIFRVRHFQQLIGEKQRLRGQPVADPFLVARARALGGCVVTEEAHKPEGAKVPNVCDHFGVEWTNMQGLLQRMGWRY